jgi:hypothetical protein
MRTTLPSIRLVVDRPAQICEPVISLCRRMISLRQPALACAASVQRLEIADHGNARKEIRR